jgi:hypothetical protein
MGVTLLCPACRTRQQNDSHENDEDEFKTNEEAFDHATPHWLGAGSGIRKMSGAMLLACL